MSHVVVAGLELNVSQDDDRIRTGGRVSFLDQSQVTVALLRNRMICRTLTLYSSIFFAGSYFFFKYCMIFEIDSAGPFSAYSGIPILQFPLAVSLQKCLKCLTTVSSVSQSVSLLGII